MLEAQKFCQIDKSLVIRRIRKGSITQTNSEKNVLDRFDSYQHYMSFVDTNIPNIFSQEDKRKALREAYLGLLRIYFKCVSLGKSMRENHAAEIKKAIAHSWQVMDARKCMIKVRIATYFVFLFPPMLNGVIYRINWRLKHPID